MEPCDSSVEPAKRRQFWGPVSQRLEFLRPLEGLGLCAKALGCHWRPESRGCCNSHFRISLSGCGRLVVSQAAPSWPPGVLWWQGVLCLDIFGQSFHSTGWMTSSPAHYVPSHARSGLGTGRTEITEAHPLPSNCLQSTGGEGGGSEREWGRAQ